MRRALSAGLLLCALACNTEQPTGTAVGVTPGEGVLHAPAVGAKPGDQAVIIVTGATLSGLSGAWIVPPGAGNKDSIPARFTIGTTGDTAFVSVVVPSSGNMWDLVLAFPHAERRLVTPLRASGGPATAPVDSSPPPPPPIPLIPDSITLDPSPPVRIPPGRAREIDLTGHGLQGVSVVTIRRGPGATGRSVTTTYFSASEDDLSFMWIMDSTATPGTTYDLEVKGTSTAGPVDIVIPAFLVVDELSLTILDFAGGDTITQPVVLDPNGSLCVEVEEPRIAPCTDYVIRLPAPGQLDVKLAWRVETLDDVIAHARLQVDHPVQAKSGVRSPLELVASGDAGDVIRISVMGKLYFGGGKLTLTFTSRP